MNTHKRLNSALFAAAVLGLGLALPAHGTGLPDACQVASDDGVAPTTLASIQGCRSLGYQDGCTVWASHGYTKCSINGKTVRINLTDWNRRLSFNSETAIQRVLVKKRFGFTECSYNLNPSDDLDGNLAAPFNRRIARVTFCTDPQQAVARELRPCPHVDTDIGEICTNLNNPLYYVVNSLTPGVPAAICPCQETTSVTSCESSPGLPGSCFLEDGRGVFESLAQDIIRIDGSNCAVHCFPIDGVRRCKEICLP